ncbi:MAG: nitroreductase [Oscillospiraceae bacterium]|nr:nitroreductase [Oscillospiraceae bacterium]
MNEILNALKTRRSCRSFKPDMLPQEIIDRICEAGTYAATGMNRQSPVIVAIKDKQVRDRLAEINAKIMGKENFDPFYGAPVVLFVLADTGCPTYQYDGTLVMGNLMLAAHALGIGSCWIHRAKEESFDPEVKAILEKAGITENYEGIGHCVIGYPADAPREAPPRKEGYVRQLG